MKKIIIAAVSKNGVIGKRNKIPWHIKEELLHFKNTTLGYPVILGRKTFQSIGKPLPGRLNIIITRRKKIAEEYKSVLTFPSLGKAYEYLRKNKFEKVFICGGEHIYKTAVASANEMIISYMNFEAEGDKKFPKINLQRWRKTKEKKYDKFTVVYYEEKSRNN